MKLARTAKLHEMRPERIRQILEEYLFGMPSGIEYQVHKYIDLLRLWQAKMPLSSIHDPEEIVRFHFGESIFASCLISGAADGRLADVGTGAGFPGLPIKLVKPGLSVELIEPNRKKCAFLHEVLRSLDISGTKVVSSSFESSEIEPSSLSFVTCRALGNHSAMLRWARGRLKRDGSVILWLGRDDLINVSATPGWKWDRGAQILGSCARFILRGVPND